MAVHKRIEPGPGQESVWDYPRPPRLETSEKHIQVLFNGVILADSTRSVRVLETSHPPVYYIPPDDILMAYLSTADRRTFCEFKGEAAYYNIDVDGIHAANAAWYYPNPITAYRALKDYVAFYPAQMERCTVDGEVIRAQEGDFYGGWLTADIVGPFKGSPGTWGW